MRAVKEKAENEAEEQNEEGEEEKNESRNSQGEEEGFLMRSQGYFKYYCDQSSVAKMATNNSICTVH